MSKAIDKDYLLNQLKNLDEKILEPKYNIKEVTQDEYDALTEAEKKDKTFLITDDEMASEGATVHEIIRTIYPVGSIYININDINPHDIFGFGVWQRIAKNMALWGAANDGEASQTKAAGIPDIAGQIKNQYIIAKKDGSDTYNAFTGIAYDGTGNYGNNYSSADWGCGVNFRASAGEVKSNGTIKNDVYGKSDTVQPPALVVNIWQRVM